jgi:hypothetical protein
MGAEGALLPPPRVEVTVTFVSLLNSCGFIGAFEEETLAAVKLKRVVRVQRNRIMLAIVALN